jgi:hypothetical protein
MGTISEITLQSSTEYFTASFITEGMVYDVVFTRHNECNLAWEAKEVVNVQLRGADVQDDDLWKDIHEHLGNLPDGSDPEIVQFTIELGRDYMDILGQLMKQVFAGSYSSPEGALEAMIFSQIKAQSQSTSS